MTHDTSLGAHGLSLWHPLGNRKRLVIRQAETHDRALSALEWMHANLHICMVLFDQMRPVLQFQNVLAVLPTVAFQSPHFHPDHPVLACQKCYEVLQTRMCVSSLVRRCLLDVSELYRQILRPNLYLRRGKPLTIQVQNAKGCTHVLSYSTASLMHATSNKTRKWVLFSHHSQLPYPQPSSHTSRKGQNFTAMRSSQWITCLSSTSSFDMHVYECKENAEILAC